MDEEFWQNELFFEILLSLFSNIEKFSNVTGFNVLHWSIGFLKSFFNSSNAITWTNEKKEGRLN